MIILGKPIVGRKETLEYANRKFNWPDGYLGIGHFHGLKAWFLSRIKGKKCIYYCIDFYTQEVSEGFFDRIFIWLTMLVDRFLISHADEVWDISERINFGRTNHGYVSRKSRIVPLSYPPSYFRFNRYPNYSCVFTGLVPYGKKIWPKDTIWIGKGELELNDLLGKIAYHAIGISLWEKDGNNYYGDPGKTKLYLACGLPVITTGNTPFSKVIEETNSGIVVRYDKRDVERAKRRIIKNYKIYKSNVRKTWKLINAKYLFRDFKLLGS